MLALTLLVVAAPPLAPGPHRCGTQWDDYREICTVSMEGDTIKVATQGPGAMFSGTIIPVDAKSFDLDGELEITDLPVGYSPMTMCSEKSPLRFRNTGKRKYFRHTRTCEDMTTTYFDIFIDVADAAKIELTRKMSSLVGKHAIATGGKACEPLTAAQVGDDSTCARWAESGYGGPYYDCPRVGAAGRLYVFDKPKVCEVIADRLNSP